MSKCRHVVLEDVTIAGAGGAVLASARAACALKREAHGVRLPVLTPQQALALAENADDDSCPFALRETWKRCACYEED